MINRIVSVLVLLLVLGRTRASANISPPCILDGKLWPQGSSIPIYVNASSIVNATGLPFGDVENGIRRAAVIINEEYGSHIKLYYAGSTSQTFKINNAILIVGDSSTCRPEGNIAADVARYYGTSVYANRIRFFRLGKDGNGVCTPHQWRIATEVEGVDFVRTLIHEIGHGVFDVQHPNEDEDLESGNCVDNGQVSMMKAGSLSACPNCRVPKDWDVEIFQQRYPLRSQTSRFIKAYQDENGGGVWLGASEAGGVGGTPNVKALFRPGSVAQNAPNISVAWGRNPNTSTTLFGGAAFPSFGRYTAGSFASQQNMHAAGVRAMPRTVAVARKHNFSGPGEVLLAYQVRLTEQPYITDSDIGLICYRRSIDDGVTFGSETCGNPANAEFQSRRGGLTVAYNKNSDGFLIGYVANVASTVFGFSPPAVWHVPSLSNPNQTSVATTFFNSGTWHAPAVSCIDDAPTNECLVVYEAPNNTGCIRWFRADVNQFGFLNEGEQIERTACLSVKALDTPGLVFDYNQSSFVIALAHGSTSIHSFRLFTTTWVNNGQVYNGTDFVSSPVLGLRTNSFGTRVQAWFLDYR